MKRERTYSSRPVCLLAPAALIAALGLGTASHAFAAQEIDVQGKSTSIISGDITPDVADDTDFGDVSVSTDAAKTYTILNTGDADLALNGTPLVKLVPVATDDTGCEAFEVTTLPTTPIAADANTTFTVTYNQTESGSLDKCKVSIANDDADENPYDFVIQASTVPEMDVQGGATPQSITDGETATSAAQGTLFAAGGGVAKTYTILNTGGGNLTLTGTPLVDLVEFADGDGSCAAFGVTTQPASPIAAGDDTAFVVTYTPPASENGTPCKVSIANDDADENPYDFAIQVALPEIDVQGKSVSIADNDTTPSAADDTNFGGVPTSTDVIKTYTILNIGGADLTLGADPVADDGAAGCDFFTIAQPTSTTLAPGASTTFTVTYKQATANEVNTCGISIVNDDADENPYDFNIQASTGPEIDVQGNSVSIADGDDTPSSADDTDFGGVPTSTDVTKTYTILNSGGADLTLGADPVSNDGAAGCTVFTITQPTETTIAAGASTTFTVTYNQATADTENTCGISIANDDADESPYNFTIKASTGPEMDVQGKSVSIADGDDTPDVADDTDFGAVQLGTTVSKTYTILNTGGADLTLAGTAPDYVVLNGEGCASFKVTTQPTTPIAVGATPAVTFTVEYAPTAVSEGEQCTVSIENNDSNENPYDFVIQGKGGKSGGGHLPAVYQILLNSN